MIGDAAALATVLRHTPPSRRIWVFARCVQEACAADRHMRATGRPHPVWGDGSLMAAALRRGIGGMGALEDAEFAVCLGAVILSLPAISRGRRKCRSEPPDPA